MCKTHAVCVMKYYYTISERHTYNWEVIKEISLRQLIIIVESSLCILKHRVVDVSCHKHVVQFANKYEEVDYSTKVNVITKSGLNTYTFFVIVC